MKVPEKAKFGRRFSSAEKKQKTEIQNLTKISTFDANFNALNMTWSANYLSIEPKKETLHFFLSFLQICTFFTIKVLYFNLTHRWFILVKLFLTFALTKILNTQPGNWLHQANFPSKMPTTYQLFASINYPSTKNLKIILSF